MRTLGKAAVRIEEFYVLNDVCLDEERRIVVTEFKNNRIQVMSREGETISIRKTNRTSKLLALRRQQVFRLRESTSLHLGFRQVRNILTQVWQTRQLRWTI